MEKKINKKMVIQGLVIASTFIIGYRIGVKAGGQKFNDGLEALATTGLTASKLINGRNYVLSINQEL